MIIFIYHWFESILILPSPFDRLHCRSEMYMGTFSSMDWTRYTETIMYRAVLPAHILILCYSCSLQQGLLSLLHRDCSYVFKRLLLPPFLFRWREREKKLTLPLWERDSVNVVGPYFCPKSLSPSLTLMPFPGTPSAAPTQKKWN
jgi:hypothetical protein